MGRPMIYLGHNQGTPDRKEAGKIADHPSKIAWERDNVIKLTVKINRTQNPELYELFTRENGSRSALAKSLMNQGLQQSKK